jgi:hypothetical protein
MRLNAYAHTLCQIVHVHPSLLNDRNTHEWVTEARKTTRLAAIPWQCDHRHWEYSWQRPGWQRGDSVCWEHSNPAIDDTPLEGANSVDGTEVKANACWTSTVHG